MPLMSIRDYLEPEQLEAAYIGAKAEITPSGRGPVPVRVARLELDRLRMFQVNELAPRIKWTAQSPDRSFIQFLTQPGADYIVDGITLRPGEVIHVGGGHTYYDRTEGPVRWAGLSLPADELSETGTAITGRSFMAFRDATHITPPRQAMARLRRLHADALALVEAVPQAALTPDAARSLEQSVTHAMIDCLRGHDAGKPAWVPQCHATVMRRFRRAIEASPNRAFYMPEICDAIGVPERTLRLCCQEHLGMSPKQYLLRRRLHLAHRALHVAEASTTTVTEIAMNFGFWHFGRFAGAYRLCFGEPPSATLARRPDCRTEQMKLLAH